MNILPSRSSSYIAGDLASNLSGCGEFILMIPNDLFLFCDLGLTSLTNVHYINISLHTIIFFMSGIRISLIKPCISITFMIDYCLDIVLED